MDNTPSLYAILGLNQNASKEEIKKAFKQKALIMHPDKGGDPEEVYLNVHYNNSSQN